MRRASSCWCTTPCATLLRVQLHVYPGHGTYTQAKRHSILPNKLLLDPYAKAIEGNIDGDESLYSYWFNDSDNPNNMNDLDAADHPMKSAVINPFFDRGNDQHPFIPYSDSVNYEAHVPGETTRAKVVPASAAAPSEGLRPASDQE